jgi:ubiquinone/menaquinone biosynthesis C-methylase UbiE
MATDQAADGQLFDDWPDRYDQWFATPIGTLVKAYEAELLLELLAPQPDELILDVGCGSGIFTALVGAAKPALIGLDLSLPMLYRAVDKAAEQYRFSALAGTMTNLPFADQCFDRVYSMTALEFVADARPAIAEMNRVTRRGGSVVVTTLNSLSPWAVRRKDKAAAGHALFANMTFRSPQEMSRLAPAPAHVRTAIHFLKDDDPGQAVLQEEQGRLEQKNTGALVALAWQKQ